MTGRTHDAIAFSALVTVAAFYPIEGMTIYTLFGGVVGNIIGGVLPDIDQAGNRLWDLLPAGNYLGKVFRRVFYKHRTLTHSFLGLSIIWKAMQYLTHAFVNPAFADPNIIFVAIMIGYISHLFADSLTEEGIPLLFPLKFKFGIPPITSWRIVTGGWFENYVIMPGILVYLVFFIRNQAEPLLKIFTTLRH